MNESSPQKMSKVSSTRKQLQTETKDMIQSFTDKHWYFNNSGHYFSKPMKFITTKATNPEDESR